MSTPCVWLEPAGDVLTGLRRYTSLQGQHEWTCATGWHDAHVWTGRRPAAYQVWPDGHRTLRVPRRHPRKGPRWPTTCGKGCGYTFTPEDQWQDTTASVWTDPFTGAEYLDRHHTSHNDGPLPPMPFGAIYEAWWNNDYPGWCGPDGRSLQCVLPDGHVWHIDGTASNCDQKPEDGIMGAYDPDPNSGPAHHRCWVRVGVPPQLTVNKAGHTCTAGAGSIQSGTWHGFLTDGQLVPC